MVGRADAERYPPALFAAELPETVLLCIRNAWPADGFEYAAMPPMFPLLLPEIVEARIVALVKKAAS